MFRNIIYSKLISFLNGIKTTNVGVLSICVNTNTIFTFKEKHTRNFVTNRIGTIISMCTPFKIFNSIIRFNFINMINVREIIWVWYKGFSNKTMDSMSFIVNTYSCITSAMKTCFKKFISFDGPNTSIRINYISIIKNKLFHIYKGMEFKLKY